MAHCVSLGEVLACWSAGRLQDPRAAATAPRTALDKYIKDGNRVVTPYFHGLLADLLFVAHDADGALALADKAIAPAWETEERWADSHL
jgi:hypothetical protein